MTEEEFKRCLPANLKGSIDDSIRLQLNKCLSDPNMREALSQNLIGYTNFITQGIITIVSAINHKNYAKRLKKGVVTAVESLDFAERALLREFVLQRKSVLTLPLSEPTVRNLVDNCVLRIVDTVDEKTHKVEVIISKEARPYITYKAIGLTLGKMTEEQISQIMNARPEYAKEKMMQPNRVVVGAQSVNQLYRNKKESSEAAA